MGKPYEYGKVPREYSLKPFRMGQVFSHQIASYTNSCYREGKYPDVVLLLCPDYSHDGNGFTYDEPLGRDLNPTIYSGFMPRLEMLFFLTEYESQREHQRDSGLVSVYPLVCEIEYDLPTVVGKFAKGDPLEFLGCVKESVGVAQDRFEKRYPRNQVFASTFCVLLSDLPEIQKEIFGQMKSLRERGELPLIYKERLEYTTQNRPQMFSKLYGAETEEERRTIAFRQMCNYLAVTKALAFRFPEGCIVLNGKTPNAGYVEVKDRLLRGLLGLPTGIKTPLFNFF